MLIKPAFPPPLTHTHLGMFLISDKTFSSQKQKEGFSFSLWQKAKVKRALCSELEAYVSVSILPSPRFLPLLRSVNPASCQSTTEAEVDEVLIFVPQGVTEHGGTEEEKTKAILLAYTHLTFAHLLYFEILCKISFERRVSHLPKILLLLLIYFFNLICSDYLQFPLPILKFTVTLFLTLMTWEQSEGQTGLSIRRPVFSLRLWYYLLEQIIVSQLFESK